MSEASQVLNVVLEVCALLRSLAAAETERDEARRERDEARADLATQSRLLEQVSAQAQAEIEAWRQRAEQAEAAWSHRAGECRARIYLDGVEQPRAVRALVGDPGRVQVEDETGGLVVLTGRVEARPL